MIFHEYGELPKGKTIHSKLQLRDNNCQVFDDPEKLDGRQCLVTQEGYQIPLDFEHGLAYIKMHYPTDDEVKNLPCVVMTRDYPWDPSRYDSNKSINVPSTVDPDAVPEPIHDGFNHYGEPIAANYGEHLPVHRSGELPLMPNYGEHWNPFATPNQDRRVPSTGELLPTPSDNCYWNYDVGHTPSYITEIYSNVSLIADLNVEYADQAEDRLNYVKYRKYFLNVPASTVRLTLEATTQYYRTVPSTNKFMTYRSPYPALNVFRRHETVYTDTVFADVTAWGGFKAAQVFVGKMSRYISVHGCKTDADFPRCLEDEIRKRGAMDKLASDRARAETSSKVYDILRTLFIQDWQTEPYYHHQNFAERMIQELKKFSNWVLNWSSAPPEAWYDVFEYVTRVIGRSARLATRQASREDYQRNRSPCPRADLALNFYLSQNCRLR